MRTITCPVCHATLTPSLRRGDLESTLTLSGVTLNCGGCVQATRVMAEIVERKLWERGCDALKARIFGPIDPATDTVPAPDFTPEMRDFLNRKATGVA